MGAAPTEGVSLPTRATRPLPIPGSLSLPTYILLLTILSPGASGSIAASTVAPTFPTLQLCEAARDAYATQAAKQGGWFTEAPRIVSTCVRAS